MPHSAIVGGRPVNAHHQDPVTAAVGPSGIRPPGRSPPCCWRRIFTDAGHLTALMLGLVAGYGRRAVHRRRDGPLR
jgi:hypothetical protein